MGELQALTFHQDSTCRLFLEGAEADPATKYSILLILSGLLLDWTEGNAEYCQLLIVTLTVHTEHPPTRKHISFCLSHARVPKICQWTVGVVQYMGPGVHFVAPSIHPHLFLRGLCHSIIPSSYFLLYSHHSYYGCWMSQECKHMLFWGD